MASLSPETYIDGFVIPVHKDKKDAYLKMAKMAAEIWKDHGALEIIETWGDDVPEGKVTSFPMAVKAEPGEVVVFSWVIWPSKAARDAGNEKVMADPRMQHDPSETVFDGKRLIFGGFTLLTQG
ncbi:DUF1428 domain-containing protein [Asticcacaulis sp. 201]|uniref:DUF1428 domain-containing protein n=1 Tax=Asticcacaulis sp. 201 TaxID=3028787 RepID=UPI0029163453|nr:DUF1428 domain-containing protein [Asticcacaulis sp. 201]MDV6331625.1 DUF1428 domain-containing protein [Asticcacaulis sp. 201]